MKTASDLKQLARVALVAIAVVLGLASSVSAQQGQAAGYQALTISTTATRLSDATIRPNGTAVNVCQFVVETNPIRVRVDGELPTSSEGQPFTAGSSFKVFGYTNLRQFAAIRSGAADAGLKVACYYGANDAPLVITGVGAADVSVSGSNPAASAAGAAVPASASYTGVNVAGNLRGVTGFAVGSHFAPAFALVDGSGNQVTSFGGGTQYPNAQAQATPTGTVALGWDGANVRALSTNGSGQQIVTFPSAQPISAASLPLPTGASTLAEQQSQTTHLNTIQGWNESARAKVNPIVGQAGVAAGTGTIGNTTQRITIATDDVVSSSLAELASAINTNALSVAGSVTAVQGAAGASAWLTAARLQFSDGTNVSRSQQGSIEAIPAVLIDPDTDAPVSYAGACTPSSIIGANTVNETEIKDTAGKLDLAVVTNIGSNEVFFKLYDLDNDDLDENDTPVQRYAVPADPSAAGFVIPIPAGGMNFAQAISFRITAGMADNNTGAIPANEVLVSWCYR